MGYWKENLGIENVEFQERPAGFGKDWVDTINLTRDDVVIRYPDAASYMNAAANSTSVTATDTMNGYSNPEIDKVLALALKARSVGSRAGSVGIQGPEDVHG
ncbi:hypothetical protein PSQ19_16280 [Devosia algicola]|uniref:Uncharacterized protein n=1 Tax=Devosia algicola TaxID=3026418 RepID=A0ABY7YLX2_9HYPH|nr:hypothetical protein [Devosia algicola]WDR02187.1 hypothetical protein PSQ19_16280 [Devosia algicola]